MTDTRSLPRRQVPNEDSNEENTDDETEATLACSQFTPVCCSFTDDECPMDMQNAGLKCGLESTGCDAASEEDFQQKCDDYMVMAGNMHMGRSTCGQEHCNGARASNSAPATAAARRADADPPPSGPRRWRVL